MQSKNLIIVYGSQTGTAQDLAERVWRRAKHTHHHTEHTELCSFDQLDLNKLLSDRTRLVCVCSTTGQGDVPDNMLGFWRNIMRKQIPANFLAHLEFACIGLGDSSYDKYNFVAKKLHKRLLQLGGKSLVDLCLCDEQSARGVEGAFSNWSESFWQLLDEDSSSAKSNYKYDPSFSKYRIEFIDQPSAVDNNYHDEENKPATDIRPFYARLCRNERLTATDHFQDVRLLEFDCDTPRVEYNAGDVLGMRPSNHKHVIDKFLDIFSHLALDLNALITVRSNFPDEVQSETETDPRLVGSVRDLVERYFDLNSVPRMSFFETLAKLASDELEREKLEEFLMGENAEDLFNYCYRPRRTIIEGESLIQLSNNMYL
jgi:sulfite reductase alpha subunit-like flavoprotein